MGVVNNTGTALKAIEFDYTNERGGDKAPRFNDEGIAIDLSVQAPTILPFWKIFHSGEIANQKAFFSVPLETYTYAKLQYWVAKGDKGTGNYRGLHYLVEECVWDAEHFETNPIVVWSLEEILMSPTSGQANYETIFNPITEPYIDGFKPALTSTDIAFKKPLVTPDSEGDVYIKGIAHLV